MNYGVISLFKLHDSYFFVTQVCLKYTFLVNKYIECMSYGKKKIVAISKIGNYFRFSTIIKLSTVE